MKRYNFLKLIREFGNDNVFYIRIYSKAKTKKDLKKIVKQNPTDPPIDMGQGGPVGTPEEIRKHLKLNTLVVFGPQSLYSAVLMYKNNKWIVK